MVSKRLLVSGTAGNYLHLTTPILWIEAIMLSVQLLLWVRIPYTTVDGN